MPTRESFQAIQRQIEYRTGNAQALLERIGYSKEAYAQVVLNMLIMQPDIVDCDIKSIDKVLLQCMNAGLIPDGREAAIVPFKREAVFIPMVEGRIKLARQATPGIALRAMAVFDGDEWEYAEGLNPVLRHIPSPYVSNSPENIIYVYATARIPFNSAVEYDVMSRSTVDRSRSYSRARSGPWFEHYEEMAKNCVLKRLLKRLPKSSRDPGPIPVELEHVEDEGVQAALRFSEYNSPLLPATGESPLTQEHDFRPAPEQEGGGSGGTVF